MQSKTKKSKLLVTLGSTATGKTDLAMDLAKKFNGELVACDSRQVYTGLDIGTGKMPSEKHEVQKYPGYWVIDNLPIYMYDVVSPHQQYNVKDYVTQARGYIEGIIKENKLPIIVGGTGLYLKALLGGIELLEVPINENLRQDFEMQTLEQVQSFVQQKFPLVWANLNKSERKNKRRLIRKIELYSMYPYTNSRKNNNKGLAAEYDVKKIGLTAPRSILYKRIDRRLESRIDQGMVGEAEGLMKSGLSLNRMEALGLEYKYLAMLLRGEIDKQQFVTQLAYKIHQYAKRQLTWFKKEKDVEWFDITAPSWQDKVEKIVSIWYHSPDDIQD